MQILKLVKKRSFTEYLFIQLVKQAFEDMRIIFRTAARVDRLLVFQRLEFIIWKNLKLGW